MNYTLNQLYIFLKISEFKSITKASEALHLTQPAVSIQLKNFQSQFDIPLTENKASSHDTMFSSGYIRNHIGNLYLFNRIHPFLSSLYIPMIHQILQDIFYSSIAFFKAVSPWLVSLSIAAASFFPFFA